MENNKETTYSHEAAEAQSILNRRHASDNGSEVTAWICLSGDITKSYRDGYISDQDIMHRENFVNYSFNRESMLTTCMGLLEKSNDPKAKEQIEALKKHLSILRVCRANIIQNTPPKNVAKMIQKRQEESMNKNSASTNLQNPFSSPISNNNNNNSDSLFAGLLGGQLSSILATTNSPFRRTGDEKFDQQNALLATLLVAALGKKALESLNSAGNKPDPKTSKLAEAYKFLQEMGIPTEAIHKISSLDVSDKNFATDMKEIFTKAGLTAANFAAMQHGVREFGYAQYLRESIYKNSMMMPNAYDASIINPMLNQKIDGMSREDIIAHQKQILALRTASARPQTPSQNRPSFTVDNFIKKSIVSARE